METCRDIAIFDCGFLVTFNYMWGGLIDASPTVHTPKGGLGMA